MTAPGVFIHPQALVESTDIGAGTRIWAHVHVMKDVKIGRDCNICDGAFIESGVAIGRGVTIKQRVEICEGVMIADGVFIGPGAVFTNDLHPRSPRTLAAVDRYEDKSWLTATRLEVGATLGANSTIVCGVTMGPWSFAAAGAVVVRNVASFTLVAGNPARPIGRVCACGLSLTLKDGAGSCGTCGRKYLLEGGQLRPTQPIQLWNE